MVSDTLEVTQANENDHGDGGVNIVPARFRPNVLIGSTSALPSRPTIVLKAKSKDFGNAKKPKNLIKITNPRAENINMVCKSYVLRTDLESVIHRFGI